MTFVETVSMVYAASGVAGCACYAPQMAALLRDAQARRALSLASWSGWLGLGLVAVLYAAVVADQAAMVVVSGLNALCQSAVVALVAGQRWRDRLKQPRPASTDAQGERAQACPAIPARKQKRGRAGIGVAPT